jgi:ABC-type branched-subunit amino acid transport system substrate-binding protein
MMRSPWRIAAAVTAVALLAAACGSSSSSSTAPKLSGEPIVIGQITPLTGAALSLAESGVAMTAAVKYFNDHGGLFGRPLKLVQCNSNDLPNQEVACAQTLVNDGAVAEIGGDLDFNVAAAQATLVSAHIPRIAMLRATVGEYQTATDYDPTAGTLLGVASLPVAAVLAGCKRVSIVTLDAPAASGFKALINPIVAVAGGTLTNVVLVPSGAADYTQYLLQAEAGNSCATVVALGVTQANAFMDVYNQLKPSLKLVLPSATYTSADLAKLGSAPKQALFSYAVPGADDPGVPGLKNLMAILDQGGSGMTPATTSGNSELAVLGMQAFMEAMNQYKSHLDTKGTITGTDVIDAMNAAKDLNLWGVVPAWTPSTKLSAGPVFGSYFENISNPMEYSIRWNGHYSNTGTFNILKYIPGAPAASTSITS